MSLTITKRLGGPTTVEGDLADLDRLPEMARARRRIRARFVAYALLDELTHPRYLGYLLPDPRRNSPSLRRCFATLDPTLLMHTQPMPIRRGPKLRRKP